ncbi:MAG: CHASE2 domain-containing protein [Elusimicrobiota bacterium]
MKKRAWIADALLGLFLTVVVLGSFLLQASWIESLELKLYDMRAQLRTNLDPSSDIVLVAIDDDSIARLGRWPWSRTRIAQLLSVLKKAEPRVIGLDIVLSEPQRNPALEELDELRRKYVDHVASRKIIQRGVAFEDEFSSATVRLDTDSQLLAALTTAQNVVLPMFFTEIGGTMGGKPPDLHPALSTSAVSVRVVHSLDGPPPVVQAQKATTPIAPFIEASAGVGYVNIIPDIDGVVRRETLAIKYGETFFPSYALQVVARYLRLAADEIIVTPGSEIEIGNTKIPLDQSQSMLVTFNGPEKTFRYYSFYEVLEGKVAMDVFKDKIVIVGPSAAGIGTLYVTPVARALPAVEFIANVMENILSRRFLVRPEWAMQAELGAIAVLGLFIMFLLPRLRALGGASLTFVLLAGMIGAGFYVFQSRGEWVKVVYPSFLLLAGYLVSVTKRFFVTEKGKEFVEASQIETNKMLGLSFQGQGMLDGAFEKFRLCPLDDTMMDTLYNLALDFERKRQYAKAVQVYKHIATKDEKYKDIQDKMKTLQAAAQGAVFGGVGGRKQDGTVIVTGGATTPTLGRYEIEKELGRGAMGIVYLGKDPKINRRVAIKTLMLEEGESAAEVKQVKERFFREAESAGTLNHPGIVRVFDAGEEQDICYIAMELLDGDDLVRFTTKENMLAPDVAMEYIAVVADALDYAHQQGIVHRDIKPANIMLIKDGSIRVTDFGIARITASSKTATGTVMGTPSYMSPEQVAGKRVDGRSDLFSLGVTLFEFLTGEKPFKGGEGIGTLLFQIANDPEPDPLSVNPKMPPCAKKIIHKALVKKPEERYQRGSELAKDLRACIAGLKDGGAEAGGAPTPEQIASTLAMPAGTGPVTELPAAEKVSEPAPAPEAEPVVAALAAEAESPAPQAAADGLKIDIEIQPGPGAKAPAQPSLEPAAAAEPPAPKAEEGGLKIDIEIQPGPGAMPPAEPAVPKAEEGGLKIEMPGQAGVGGDAPAEPAVPTAEEGGLKIEWPGQAGVGGFAPAEPAGPKAEEPALGQGGFSPDEVAETLVLSPQEAAQFRTPPDAAEPAPQAEPAQPPAGAAPDETMRLVESIMPQIAPDSLRPEDITTSRNLAGELEKEQRKRSEPPAQEPPPVTGPEESPDPGETIRLVDPNKPS